MARKLPIRKTKGTTVPNDPTTQHAPESVVQPSGVQDGSWLTRNVPQPTQRRMLGAGFLRKGNK